MRKKILVFCPKFFGYDNKINEAFSKYSDVSFYDERPNNSFLYKSILRMNIRWLIKWFNDLYYNKIIFSDEMLQYDMIIFINPEAVSNINIEKMRKINDKAKFILYLWDSIGNKKNFKLLIDLFDVVYSFDQADTICYENIELLPLFFTDDFHWKYNDIIYDACFIGTAHSDRVDVLNKIINKINNVGKKSIYTRLYMPSRIIYWFRRLLDSNFINNYLSKSICFDSISLEKTAKIMSVSEIIIDINHAKQSGLTMRVMESIGSGKKIITTNENIKYYSFYDPKNICIINRDNVDIDKDFLFTEKVCKNPYFDVDNYSIDSWVKKILNS